MESSDLLSDPCTWCIKALEGPEKGNRLCEGEEALKSLIASSGAARENEEILGPLMDPFREVQNYTEAHSRTGSLGLVRVLGMVREQHPEPACCYKGALKYKILKGEKEEGDPGKAENLSTLFSFTLAPVPGETLWSKELVPSIDSSVDLLISSGSCKFEVRREDKSKGWARMEHRLVPASGDPGLKVHEVVDCVGIVVPSHGEGRVSLMVLGFRRLGEEDEAWRGGLWTPLALCERKPLSAVTCSTFLEGSRVDYSKLSTMVENVVDMRTLLVKSEPLMKQIKADLISFFASKVEGDTLAAEYLLMFLSQRLADRDEAVGGIGNWTLNIANWTDQADTSALLEALRDVCPQLLYLPLSLSELNAAKWTPCLENESVKQGCLQCAPGSLLVFDETLLTAGTVRTDHLLAIGSSLGKQTVPCKLGEFGGEVQFPVECKGLILSEGASLFSKEDYASTVGPVALVYIQKKTETAVQPSNPPPDTVKMFRLFLAATQLARGEGSMTTEVADKCVDFWVSKRRTKAGASESLLHLVNALARSAAVTNLEPNASGKTWEHLMALEKMREGRKPAPVVAKRKEGA